MADVLLGILAIVAGSAMLLAGRFVLRFAIPIWGFFAGFAFGADSSPDSRTSGCSGRARMGVGPRLRAALRDPRVPRLLRAVTLAMASFGFAIGSGLVVALGIEWTWPALGRAGDRSAFGFASIVANVPMIVLVVLVFLRRGRRCGGRTDVAGGLAELRRLHPGRLRRHHRRCLGLVAAGGAAFAGIVIQAGQRVLMRRTVKEAWFIEAS